jgi:hypothetical protein
MAKRLELPLPVERPRAGFDTNNARFPLSNFRQQSFSADATLPYGLSVDVGTV